MQRNIALVNLDNVVRNAENIRSLIGSAKLCAVVKCDGYGHGAAAIANALHGVCDSFAVALVDEGAQIRAAGVDEDILVLQPALDETEVLRAAAYNMILTLADDNDFLLVKKTCEKFGVRVRVHLKANTGMNRLGYEYWQFLNSCLLVKKQTNISVEGVYSHFYLPESRSETRAQYELFLRFCSVAEGVFGKLTKHIAASGGVFADSAYHMDMVRCGIALYGYLPRGIKSDKRFLPALCVYTHAVSGRKYEFGGVAYGRANGRSGDLTTLRIGYGDGFLRAGGIGNINNLCMDACVVSGAHAKGEPVLIFADADEYARRHNTISYEALCSVTKRAEFVYVRGLEQKNKE